MTPQNNRIFGYCRASTKKQVESPEIQKHIIESYVSMNRLGEVDAFYVDAATSGKVPMIDRTAGREMIARIRRGDVLVIAKLDRAFRKLGDCVTILEQLENIGVHIHVCSMSGAALDLSSPMGKFMVHILAAFAELERAFISERTKEGMAGLAKRGAYYTHYPGYGFQWTTMRIGGKTEKIKTPHEGERAVMREMVAWRLQDPPLSFHRIAKILDKERKVLTKDGKRWTHDRCAKATMREFQLQIIEQRNANK